MKRFLLLLLIFGLAFSVKAQSGLQHRPPPASDYVLGPGDQISLHITDLEELPDKPITIDPSGYIDLPLAGRLHADGLTLNELKSTISKQLGIYITKPEISMNLVASGSQPVSVIGEVSTPGVHQLVGSKRLLEVLSLAGGLKQDAGPKVLVTRQQKWGQIDAPHVLLDPATGATTATFSIDDLMSSKAPQDNILIRPEDVVSVPRADLVYVVGDVRKAGGFQVATHQSVSLLQALSMAEGLGPDHSARHARILRPVPGGDGTPREIPVDVEKIFAGKAPDVPLFGNDVLYIPRSGVKVTARRALDAAIGVGSGILIYH